MEERWIEDDYDLLGEEEYRKTNAREKPMELLWPSLFEGALTSHDRDLAEGQDFMSPGGTDFAHPSVQVVSICDALTIGRIL